MGNLIWLFDMSEDGKPCGDWPAINFSLETFGKVTERPICDPDAFSGYRIAPGSKPDIPGVIWVPLPISYKCGEKAPEQRWVAMTKMLGPRRIAYSLCYRRRHVRVEEILEKRFDIRWLKGVEDEGPCLTNHAEHRNRVAIDIPTLPVTTRDALDQFDRTRPPLKWLLDLVLL